MNSQALSRPKVLLVNRAIIQNKKSKILLIKRAENDPWAGGYWELPGGKLEKGQDVSEALENEIFEETGLKVTPSSRLVYWESRILKKGPYKNLLYLVIIGLAQAKPGPVNLSKEHSDWEWVDDQEMPKYKLTPETRRAFLALKKTPKKRKK